MEINVKTTCTLTLDYEEMVMLRAALARLKKYVDKEKYMRPNPNRPDYDYGQMKNKACNPFLYNLHNSLRKHTGESIDPHF